MAREEGSNKGDVDIEDSDDDDEETSVSQTMEVSLIFPILTEWSLIRALQVKDEFFQLCNLLIWLPTYANLAKRRISSVPKRRISSECQVNAVNVRLAEIGGNLKVTENLDGLAISAPQNESFIFMMSQSELLQSN